MDESVRTAVPHPTTASPISCSSSLQRRVCRICQSETGVMVRPCDCAGTMGDIHENCLSTWVTMSKKDNCEICQEAYQRTGYQYKRLKEWSRPDMDANVCINIWLVLGLALSLIYKALLFDERKSWERLVRLNLPLRTDDLGRLETCRAGCGYLGKQKEVRFANKP